MQRAAHPGTLYESNELGATSQIHVLTVVDDMSVDLKRRGASSEQAASFEQFDVPAGVFQLERGSQAR
jgi:hypothetical protein